MAVDAPAHQFFGHPKGLSTLFFVEAWERFTYYGMRALLILFLTASLATGGLGMTAEEAGAIYGLFTAGVYLLSLPGGWLADRLLGHQTAVFLGGLLIALGNFLLAVPGDTAVFYSGLLVIALGVGLLKPNVSVMVGELYKNQSPARRDAGFSLFYFGIYLGAFTAPLVAGTLGETLGYRWGFLAAGVAMLLGLAQYRATLGWLGGIGQRPEAVSATLRRNSMAAIALTAVALGLLAWSANRFSFGISDLANVLGVAMVALAVVFFGGIFLYGGLVGAERKHVLVIVALCACVAVFIAGLEQAGSTMNLFARDFTDRSLFGDHFSTGRHPASWYQSIAPSFVLIMSPLFAWLWISLGRKGLDPSTPIKFGLSLILLGSSFLVMMLAVKMTVQLGLKASPAWLISVYFLQTLGELCIGPIGLSGISKLSPRRYAGQMMGMWFLATAVGSLVAGVAGGAIGSAAVADLPRHFLTMAAIGIATSTVMLLAARPLSRLMRAQ
ncbi:MAG: peptide MFS transporter [Sphingomonadales bacterium]|nr:peptide MFS transporter [Sphingomonadales bacterium]